MYCNMLLRCLVESNNPRDYGYGWLCAMVVDLNHLALHQVVHVGLTSEVIATSYRHLLSAPGITLALSAQKSLLLGSHDRLIVELRGHLHDARSAHAVASTSG